MASTPIIDLHVHSTMKPYGNSFYPNNSHTLLSSPACIWYSDYRTLSDFKFETLIGVSRYRQADFNSLTTGQVRIACVSLYPVEKQFFEIVKKPLQPFEEFFAQLVTMFGRPRIENIEKPEFSYFTDLCREYTYLRELNGSTIHPRSYKMIAGNTELGTEADLLVIPSFEGCHAFCNTNDPAHSDWEELEENVKTVKNWESPPLFVTFAHHFYNGLCTHAKSLFGIVGKLLDQSVGMRDYNIVPHDGLTNPITEHGYRMIRALLRNNGEDWQRRILIDVKHMSRDARNAYYTLLDSDEFRNEKIPVVYSHGAFGLDEPLEINLNTDDLLMIYKTNGIIGLEIDQRILGYDHSLVNTATHTKERKAFDESAYVFRQIIAIAEFACQNGYQEDPWKCIALGSDYDGIINPLNSYPDATWLTLLYENLMRRMFIYMNQPEKVIPNKEGVAFQDIVYRIMYKNAYAFIKEHYHK